MPNHDTVDTRRVLRARLRELDDILRARRDELRRLRDDLRQLQLERGAVAEELASLRAALVNAVTAHLAQGLSVREIARAVKQPPAVVSRVIEQVRAAGRKKKRRG